jgi:hypothetical protein
MMVPLTQLITFGLCLMLPMNVLCQIGNQQHHPNHVLGQRQATTATIGATSQTGT